MTTPIITPVLSSPPPLASTKNILHEHGHQYTSIHMHADYQSILRSQ